MSLSTGGGILSTITVRLVRLVRSGGPGFVPFLFPSFMSASEASDLAPHDGCERESSPGRAYGHYRWRQPLSVPVLRPVKVGHAAEVALAVLGALDLRSCLLKFAEYRPN